MKRELKNLCGLGKAKQTRTLGEVSIKVQVIFVGVWLVAYLIAMLA